MMTETAIKQSDLYSNRDNECFGTSLANLLLVKFSDRKIADVVRDLVLADFGTDSDGGTLFTIWPDLAEFATGRNYVGRLFTTKVIAEAGHGLAKGIMSRMRYQAYKQRFDENVDAGKIVFSEGYDDGPSILNLQMRDGTRAHAVVKMPDKTYIDNGRIAKGLGDYMVIAALEIEKRQKCP